MPKELRVVRDSKHSGTFTKREIDRAIRTVERTQDGDYVRKNERGRDSGKARGSASPSRVKR
jgi:hypothetical protein